MPADRRRVFREGCCVQDRLQPGHTRNRRDIRTSAWVSPCCKVNEKHLPETGAKGGKRAVMFQIWAALYALLRLETRESSQEYPVSWTNISGLAGVGSERPACTQADRTVSGGCGWLCRFCGKKRHCLMLHRRESRFTACQSAVFMSRIKPAPARMEEKREPACLFPCLHLFLSGSRAERYQSVERQGDVEGKSLFQEW